MTPLEISAQIKKDADVLVEQLHLHELCKPIGDIVFTGSYFLDLMIYPDIDLYIPKTDITQFMKLASKIADISIVRKMKIMKGFPGEMENGLYMKPMVDFGNQERMWKIDIWSIDNDIIRRKQKMLERYRTQLTRELRELILNYKFSILNSDGRTPMFSGVHIYTAVFDNSIRDFSEITKFLREKGIDV